MKAATGVGYNPRKCDIECICGMPPVDIVYSCIVSKLVLKTLSCSEDDLLKQELLICEALPSNHRLNNHPLKTQLATAKTFVKICKGFNMRNESLSNLEYENLRYTKQDCVKFQSTQWGRRIQHKNQLDGIASDVITPELKPLSFTIDNSKPRCVETKALNLLLKRGTRSFLYNIGEAATNECLCHTGEAQTPDHLIFNCSLVDQEARTSLCDDLPNRELRDIYCKRNSSVCDNFINVVRDIIYKNLM